MEVNGNYSEELPNSKIIDDVPIHLMVESQYNATGPTAPIDQQMITNSKNKYQREQKITVCTINIKWDLSSAASTGT